MLSSRERTISECSSHWSSHRWTRTERRPGWRPRPINASERSEDVDGGSTSSAASGVGKRCSATLEVGERMRRRRRSWKVVQRWWVKDSSWRKLETEEAKVEEPTDGVGMMSDV